MAENSDRILRIKAVLDQTGLSRSTLYRKVAAGSFPKQVKIAERCAGWRQSAINDWLHNPISYDAALIEYLQHSPATDPSTCS